MKVIADTCVWSLALRRKNISTDSHIVDLLESLIDDGLIQMVGPVRQEILSGIKSKNQFDRLQSYLTAFPDLEIQTVDYVRAAQYYNVCQSKGVQGSNTDYLVSALCVRYNMSIFTTDKDFHNFSEYLPISIYGSNSKFGQND